MSRFEGKLQRLIDTTFLMSKGKKTFIKMHKTLSTCTKILKESKSGVSFSFIQMKIPGK
jgi:hypothetical protein